MLYSELSSFKGQYPASMQVFTIRDTVSQTSGALQLAVNEKDFLRQLKANASNFKFATDMDVYSLGMYDPLKQVLVPFDTPVFVCNIGELLQSNDNGDILS